MTGPRFAPVEEMIHGIVVGDPYRWLEGRNSPETQEWIHGQQRHCDEYFAGYSELGAIRRRVREYLDVEMIDQPLRIGSRYFYRRRERGREQGCIYVRDAVVGERLLVDPSTLGSFASVAIHHVSDDGSLLAYELKLGGGEQKTIHILEVPSGRTLRDCVESGYARGFSFSRDLQGLYYSRETSESHSDSTIRFHRLGSPAADEVCFCAPRTPGSRLLLASDEVHLGAVYLHQNDGGPVIDFWIASRNAPDKWRLVFANRELPFHPILRHGRIFALSYGNSMSGTLIELSHDGDQIRTVIPQQEAMIRQVAIAKDRIFVNLLQRMVPAIQSWTFEGKNLGLLDLPTDGTIKLLPNRSSSAATSVFYTCESFIRPLAIFELRPDTEEPLLWQQKHSLPGGPSALVRNAVYSSKDETEIPMTVVEPVGTGLQPVGGPAIMTGYGGFGVPMTPQFSVLVAVMMELGVVFLLPHIRGGGEFGKEWHDSARRRNRQFAFDDFIAAAEWACAERVTMPEKLAIFGGSNSGLLVGVAITQRPDLFRAALCIAPLLDMVRYQLFDQAANWEQEYGTIADLEDFKALYAYSPYHHIKQNTAYPAVLFVTGDKDDRCNPAHVRKMAASLQDSEVQRSPIIVDYSEERGHSPVLPLSVRIDALSRRIAFLCKELNLPVVFGGQHETPRA